LVSEQAEAEAVPAPAPMESTADADVITAPKTVEVHDKEAEAAIPEAHEEGGETIMSTRLSKRMNKLHQRHQKMWSAIT
jgi:hypothetical protein